ncbi:MAG TPA: BamA/TamA family outer membrane protein [Candidatus Krumholzibacteria bacterium]|nr:BamA/TamA family outer membrane protein [Candidatus Krumholzibacteria bacterium]
MGRTSLPGFEKGSPVTYTRRWRCVKAAARYAISVAVLLQLVSSPRAARAAEPPPDQSVFLSQIIISGNEQVSTGDLKARMRTREPSMFSIFSRPRLNRGQIERDVVQLEAYYHSIGFPEARVRLDHVQYLEKDRFANVYIVVDEGRATRVATVSFVGDLLMEESRLREGLLLEPGAPYNSSLLATDIYRIKGKYFDRGYLGVAVADSVFIENYRVHIRFEIEPGTQLKVGALTIEGNRLVRRGVIEKEIEVKSGEICRFNKLLKTQRNLFETGLFTVVDVIPENIDPIERTVDIRIRVRERKGSWIEGGFGVGNVLGSRVFAEWGTRNLAGTGRTLRLKAQYAFDLFEGNEVDVDKFDVTSTFYRYDAVFQQRRFLGIKLGIGLNGYIERDATVPDLEVRTIGYAIGFNHDFGRQSEVLSGLSFEDIRRRPSGLPEERSRSHKFGVTVSRDLRDFLLDPHRGEYRVLSSEVAGGLLGGDNDYYKFTGNYQRYRGLGGRSVLAWRARVGYSGVYGRSETVPVESRYFLGGANSVRGYQDAALGPREVDATGTDRVLGGEFLLLANVEARFPLPLLARWNFSGAVFLDGGNVWGSIADVSGSDFNLTSSAADTRPGDVRYGIGAGIRYNTPVGPIRLDYGYPLKPDLYSDPGGTWYLSLGQIF